MAQSVARRVAQQVNRGSRFGARPGSRLDTYDNAARQTEETLHGMPWRDEAREQEDEDYRPVIVLDGGTETPYTAHASYGRQRVPRNRIIQAFRYIDGPGSFAAYADEIISALA